MFKDAAIGDWQLPGTLKPADSTNKAPGNRSVTMDKALMPGSNTPSPPACQIQLCPGCHLRTCSFQSTRTCFRVLPASHCFALKTPGAKRECQANKPLTPACCTFSISDMASPSVEHGGFSTNTRLPACSACRTSAKRPWGGVQKAMASTCGPSANSSASEPKLATPGQCGPSVATATSSNCGLARIAGTCWS